MNFKRAILE